MVSAARILNRYDIDRIRGFLLLATNGGSRKFQNLLQLKRDLASAVVYEPEDIPPDIVTMNTEARFSSPALSGSTVVKVVFPQEADAGEGNISLLAPLGAALLGRKIGDTVSYSAPGGEIKIKILEIVYQPESAGDYNS